MNDLLCNLCGCSCIIGCESYRQPSGLIDATVVGGYESTPGNGHGALDDCTRYRFNLCEFCLDWLFAKFQIPVRTDNPSNDYILREGETMEEGVARMGMVVLAGYQETEAWKPAAERVLEDDWRKMKKEFFDEKEKRDTARSGK